VTAAGVDVDDDDEVRWRCVKFLCSGFHPLVDGLLCYSSGSGFRVPDSGKAARWRRAR
jgi:hypothetical protein